MIGEAEFYTARLAKGRNKLARYQDFRHVFASDAGQRVLADILDICGLHQRSAVKGDPYETYFREGMRSIAISILLLMDEEPVEPPAAQVRR